MTLTLLTAEDNGVYMLYTNIEKYHCYNRVITAATILVVATNYTGMSIISQG
jgi:hypothetical protein